MSDMDDESYNRYTKIERLENEALLTRARLAAIQAVVDEQAEDEGLWSLRAETIPEDMLQRALRRLHRVIEGDGDE